MFKRTGLGLLAAACFSVAVTPSAMAALPVGSGSALTNRADDGRTAWYPSSDAPDSSVVASSSFGPVFTTTLTGSILAQPVEAQGVMIVATEADQVSGIDPVTGAIEWQQTVGTPVPSSLLSCNIITPQVGITSTPTVDPATGIVYLVADAIVDGTPTFQMHALDPTTGAEQPGFPATITGRATNHGSTRFSAADQYQRAGLLLLDGVIYTAFASHCDHAPYNGWISGTSTDGRSKGLWSTQAKSTGGGIWQSGAGLSSDGVGSIFAAVGNGTSPNAVFKAAGNFAESIVHLNVTPRGLQATDVFSPSSRQVQSAMDYDVGSGGVVILPDAWGSSASPHLAIGVSKSGNLYLLDRTRLGGVGRGPSGSDGVVASVTLPGRLWATPAIGPDGLAFIETGMGYYKYLSQQAAAQPLYAVSVDSTAGSSGLSVAASSDAIFGYGSGSPSVSSRPGVPGSGIVWVERCAVTNVPCASASLDAFSATPVDGRLQELNSWPLPSGSKFITPLVIGGRIYVGAGNSLIAFGALPASPLSGGFSAPSLVLAGGSATGTLTVSAETPVSLLAVSSSNGQMTPSIADQSALTSVPATSFTIPVFLAPESVSGEITATATVVTTGGTVPIEMVAHSVASGPLLLNATPPGVRNNDATCTLLEVGGLALGNVSVRSIPLINVGSSPLVITGVKGVHAPFSIKNGSVVGTVIAPGATGGIVVSAKGNGHAVSSDEIVLTTNDRSLHILLTVSSSTR